MCQGWSRKNINETPFLQELSTHSVTGTTHRTLETELMQNFREEDQFKYYPEYEDAEGDVPDIRIFIPKYPDKSLFNKIETSNFYGYGYQYEAYVNKNIDIEQIRNILEESGKFKFPAFDTQLFNQYEYEISKLNDLERYDQADALRAEKNKVFKNTEFLFEKEPQQLYVSLKPRVEEDGTKLFSDYIYLVKQQNGDVKVSCGIISNYEM